MHLIQLLQWKHTLMSLQFLVIISQCLFAQTCSRWHPSSRLMEDVTITGNVVLISESSSGVLTYSLQWFKTPINTEEGKFYFPISA